MHRSMSSFVLFVAAAAVEEEEEEEEEWDGSFSSKGWYGITEMTLQILKSSSIDGLGM